MRANVAAVPVSSSEDGGGPGRSGSPFGGDGVWNSMREALKDERRGGVDKTDDCRGSAFGSSEEGVGGGDSSCIVVGPDGEFFAVGSSGRVRFRMEGVASWDAEDSSVQKDISTIGA